MWKVLGALWCRRRGRGPKHPSRNGCKRVLIPFALIAWAMRPQICPHCGGAVEPKADLIQKLLG